MTDLCLDDLQPGLVLLRQVLDKKGNVLLGKGVQLSLRHLSLLRAHGVSRVAAAPPGTESTAAAVLSAEEASMLVEEQFRNTDPAHPLIEELKRICRQRRQAGAPGDCA